MNSINGYFKKLNITQNTKYDNIMIYEIAALIFITVIFFSVKTSIAYAQNFNIVAVGDFGCKSVKENNTLNLLKSLKPELFLALGDLSYKKTGNCFIEELQKNLINNTKVTIGNHDDTETDDGSDELKNLYIQEFTNGVNKNHTPYYSFDYGNIHFLSLYTNGDFEKEKETIFHRVNDSQYKFAVRDLENARTNNLTHWMIVFFHKPIYTSKSHHDSYEQFGNIYHPLFDKYGIDLVLQGHNHAYERTFPVQYNKDEASNPKITSKNESLYNDPSGQVYITSGAAGGDKDMSKYAFHNKMSFSASQVSNIPGILNLEINDKKMTGSFLRSEDGKVLDKFQIFKR